MSEIVPHLYAGERVEAADLDSLIQGCTWAYGENKTSIVLVYANTLPLADYPTGRAFGESFEVRWQRSPDEQSYNVQILCETETDYPGLHLAQQFDPVDPTGYSLLMWGNLLDEVKDRNVWREVRIPQLLEYPLEQRTQRAYLRIYDCTIGRLPITTRWLRLEGEHGQV